MEKSTKKIKTVYICSPYHADEEEKLNANIRLAQRGCKLALDKGYAPIATHLYMTQVLDDWVPKERSVGLSAGLELLKRCDAMWIIGSHISPGMEQEIANAKVFNIPVFWCLDPYGKDPSICPVIDTSPKSAPKKDVFLNFGTQGFEWIQQDNDGKFIVYRGKWSLVEKAKTAAEAMGSKMEVATFFILLEAACEPKFITGLEEDTVKSAWKQWNKKLLNRDTMETLLHKSKTSDWMPRFSRTELKHIASAKEV